MRVGSAFAGHAAPGTIVRADADIRSVRLRQLWQYWRARHNGTAPPTRRDIDPLEIPRLLPYVMLVDVLDGAADFRYRLVGTHVTTIHGADNTGKRVSECFGPNEREQVVALFRRVVREGVAIAFRGRPKRRDNRVLEYEIVHLPLRAENGAVGIVLAGLEFTLSR